MVLSRQPSSLDLPPLLNWRQFLGQFEWRQHEHVSLIGPTGAGKTTLANGILPLHPYTIVFATKKKDETVQTLLRRNYTLMNTWKGSRPDFHPDVYPRRILWPQARGLLDAPRQRKIFLPALNGIFNEGGWTVFIDETTYFIDEQMINLRAAYRTILAQGRSNNISVVSATQRPAHVPREMYDQATHLFFWQDNDYGNLKRLSEISYVNAEKVRSWVSRLPFHEVLYINSRNGTIVRTSAVAG